MSAMAEPFIHLSGVKKVYRAGKAEFLAVSQVTFDIAVTSVLQTTAGKMIFGKFDDRGVPAAARPPEMRTEAPRPDRPESRPPEAQQRRHAVAERGAGE